MEKKAAMEMSVGTLVTIVLLMAVLGLGLFLVSKIFDVGTRSVETINDKVIGQINELYSEDVSGEAVVLLGADRKAKIKQGTSDFGVVISAETQDGSATDRQRLQYRLELDTTSTGCIAALGGSEEVKALMNQNTGQWLPFDEFRGPVAYARVSFDIPKAITKCSQKILVDVRDTDNDNEIFSGTYFIIQII
jgi:hypothetical protein